MKRKYLLIGILLAMATGSCVYDFHPDIQGQAGYVSIEGDILVGGHCSFEVRSSTDLENPGNEGDPLSYALRVEAADGTVYPELGGAVDLRDADVSQEYRLVVEVSHPFRRTYASRWAPVERTAPIDSLSWEITDNGSTMWIQVSTHADTPGGYYRWIGAETWEYHATWYAEKFFAPAGTVYKGEVATQDRLFEFKDGDNTYYCWKSGYVNDIMTATTVGLSSDRLVDHRLYAFTNTDRKVSHVYHVKLTQIRLTEEAYRYWEALRSNSTDVGGLFSPEPSELRGNLANVDDPDEWVLGYVSVATCSRKEMFIENEKTGFSRWRGPMSGQRAIGPTAWLMYYKMKYQYVAPMEGTSETIWAPVECVDCRASGGTKERPSWWINNDK